LAATYPTKKKKNTQALVDAWKTGQTMPFIYDTVIYY